MKTKKKIRKIKNAVYSGFEFPNSDCIKVQYHE